MHKIQLSTHLLNGLINTPRTGKEQIINNLAYKRNLRWIQSFFEGYVYVSEPIYLSDYAIYYRTQVRNEETDRTPHFQTLHID